MLAAGELAAAINAEANTQPYYEHKGLMCSAARNQSRYRPYVRRVAMRLRFFKQIRARDFTVMAIREMLALRTRPSDRRGHSAPC